MSEYKTINLPYYSFVNLEKLNAKEKSSDDYLILNNDDFTIKTIPDIQCSEMLEIKPDRQMFAKTLSVGLFIELVKKISEIAVNMKNHEDKKKPFYSSLFGSKLDKLFDLRLPANCEARNILKSFFLTMYFSHEGKIKIVSEEDLVKFNIKKDNKEFYKNRIQFFIDQLAINNGNVYIPNIIGNEIFNFECSTNFLFYDEKNANKIKFWNSENIMINNFVFNYFEIIGERNLRLIPLSVNELYCEYLKIMSNSENKEFYELTQKEKIGAKSNGMGTNQFFMIGQKQGVFGRYYSFAKYCLLNKVDLRDIALKIINNDETANLVRNGSLDTKMALEQMNSLKNQYFTQNTKTELKI